MFFEELTPLFQEFSQTPMAFLGGFASGLLRLNLSDDPVKSWLDQQGVAVDTTASTPEAELGNRNNSKGPQSIKIE